jgi:hypothetical protein
VSLSLTGLSPPGWRTVFVPRSDNFVGRQRAFVPADYRVGFDPRACCTALEFGVTEVRVEGMRATITPYDNRALRAVCPSDSASIEHTAMVRFDAAGTPEVVVFVR